MRLAVRASTLLWLVGVGACTSIVGIEDIHEGHRPGTPEGGDGSGASSANGGSKTTEPNGGSQSSNGGVDDPGDGGAPTAGTAQGGSTTQGGAPSEGGAEQGGAGNPPATGTVNGTVVDFWGHKLPNIPVQIGDTLTSTDENGKFTIDDVPAKYDVSFVTGYEFNTAKHTYAWVYQGLTRRDPTLSSIQALEHRFGDVEIAAQTKVVGTNQTISVAFGGADGATELTGLTGALKKGSTSWEGGPTTQATAHGLFWGYDADSNLPLKYYAYDSTLLAMSETQLAKITLDLAAEPMVSETLTGTVTVGKDSGRTNEVFLHFNSGATMTVVTDDKGPATFSYLLPTIANSTISVQASEGDAYYGEYGVVRRGGLSASSKPTLAIPIPATPTSPADQITNVGPSTKFAFQSLAANPGPFVVQFDNVDTEGPFQTLYVVTAAKQLTIPDVIGGGFSLHADNDIEWRVATHGKLGSVDAMAGPQGFLQPYDYYNTVPYGPRQGDGEYTISEARYFTTAK